MVKSLFFCLCFISFFNSYSQDDIIFHSDFEKENFSDSDAYVAQLFMADAGVTTAEFLYFRTQLDHYALNLNSKRSKFKTQKDFVSHIFYKTHRKFLKRYSPFTT